MSLKPCSIGKERVKRDTLSYRSGCSPTILGCVTALPGRLGLLYHSDSKANSNAEPTQRQTRTSKQPLAANCLLSTPMPMAAESPDHPGPAENFSFRPFIKGFGGQASAPDHNRHIYSSNLALLETPSYFSPARFHTLSMFTTPPLVPSTLHKHSSEPH